MTLPMIGSLDVLVLDARPFSIHGDTYVELAVRHESGDGLLRAPSHTMTGPPVGGQRVRVTFLMGQVTGVETL